MSLAHPPDGEQVREVLLLSPGEAADLLSEDGHAAFAELGRLAAERRNALRKAPSSTSAAATAC